MDNRIFMDVNSSECAISDDREFVDELLQTVDLDCSLSCTGLVKNGWAMYHESRGDEPSPATSSSDSGISSAIDFSDAWQGINRFLSSAVSQSGPSGNVLPEQVYIEPELEKDVEKLANVVEKAKKKGNHIRKGQRYLPDFKQKVLKYAVKHTFRETADKFKINCNTLTEWAREYKRLLQLKKSTTTRPGFIQKTDVSNNLAKTNETDIPTQQESQVTSDSQFIEWLRRNRVEGTRVRRENVLAAGLAFLDTYPASADWFVSWVRRLNERSGQMRLEEQAPKADKHIFYPGSFKLEVALYAKEYTKKAAANTFGVSSRRLYEWCERPNGAEESGEGIAAARRHVESQLQLWFNQQCGIGARPKSSEISAEARALYAASGLSHVKCSQGWLERIRKRLHLKLSHADDDALLLWVLAQLDDNRSLSLLQVTSKAQQLAVEKQVSTFKGSKGWTLRFLKRHSHVLQCSSARLSDLPAAAASQARIFCRSIQQRVGAAGLSPASFGCMDEVPITFVYPTEKVQTPRLLRKAGLEAAHAVVLLAATSDGCLLPPCVVLRGQRPMQTFQVDDVSVPVLYHADGGVDARTLREWCQQTWLRSVNAPSLLVMDSFTPHHDEVLGEDLSAGWCHLAIIPPGCAVHLLPCAFNLSRRFQEAIQEEWLEYAAGRSSPEWRAKAGPNEEVILNWVVNAYRTLRKDTFSIRSSFYLTGLTKPTSNGLEMITSPDVYISKTETQV